MGSVGGDFRCPWCGRYVPFGGYVPDGIDYAICSDGPRSCLWLQAQNNGIETVSQVRSNQLRAIFHPWFRATGDTPRGPHVAAMRVPDILCAIADFLAYHA